MTYILTHSAEKDMDNIWLYIAQDNPAMASAYLKKISMVLDTIGEAPAIGTLGTVDDPDVYLFPFKQYNIFYEVLDGQVFILRVRHSSKDPDTLRL